MFRNICHVKQMFYQEKAEWSWF